MQPLIRDKIFKLYFRLYTLGRKRNTDIRKESN